MFGKKSILKHEILKIKYNGKKEDSLRVPVLLSRNFPWNQVITYRTEDSPEAVDDKAGIVVEQGDVDGLAGAIRRIKAHPLLSENCRKRAEVCFDKSKCFEEYVELYKN